MPRVSLRPELFLEALTARVRELAVKPYDAQASVLGAQAVDFDAAGKLTYGPATA
jgi:glucans biosynthesis protein